ncbi:hypothetical protein SARC_04585 [Sphaeroforma arctica JP610]|uniref:Ubiquitin-like domain-containing protein n=1 Tax=Sphaeroforma arctica JP610 TaxID=667725 RepID=A0A0L0G2W6_9EUKA|nr:hypothetical protein SARC_04585 [Sphaeroforma arctica JP610]KNC83156.1 hypothetical protein SARC_04585 [Sphaeroforma arctica JP610]|eukprot:XP_014157058.1 hypothetical protein SARC_04585 [Sphaeroforma arctica JP610]
MSDGEVQEEDLPGSISVLVKSLKGATYTIKVLPSDLVAVLKNKLSKQTAISIDQIRLILKGKAVADTSTIEEAKLSDQSKIHFTIKPAAKTTVPMPSESIGKSKPSTKAEANNRPEVKTEAQFWAQLEDYLKGSNRTVEGFVQNLLAAKK